ncbi:DNA modification methylase [Agromyces sp. SYSU K20354]|uniref:DNA modification methylase n=1 Tax=Agromyces cavernae TaxID=2898659 RepID=UPI001E2A1CBE|nr:DNA modification methylase [Agromyces cavernae]MCD2444251.1 DNA modification methylase [Agromyces cavernae]
MASAALALGIALGASGCAMLTYQATTEPYDASDGVAADVGDLDLRNILVVSDDGDEGNLVLTVVNNGEDDVELDVQLVSSGDTQTIEVAAGSTVGLGAADVEGIDVLDPILLEGIDTQPGGLVDIYFQYGSAEGIEIGVPVLDSSLPEYSDLAP